jgi:hypothetical protein
VGAGASAGMLGAGASAGMLDVVTGAQGLLYTDLALPGVTGPALPRCRWIIITLSHRIR